MNKAWSRGEEVCYSDQKRDTDEPGATDLAAQYEGLFAANE